jgi:hypothetical protein
MHQKEDDEVRLMAGIRDAAEDVREARERLRETRTALENAEENDRLIEAAYRVGTAHSVDVVDAETALRRARVNVDSARFDLLSSLVEYRYALGTLSSSDTPGGTRWSSIRTVPVRGIPVRGGGGPFLSAGEPNGRFREETRRPPTTGWN